MLSKLIKNNLVNSKNIYRLNSINVFKFSKNFKNNEEKQAVGFIGLGNMGYFMANNLAKAGYPIVCFDMNQEPIERLIEAHSLENIIAVDSPVRVADNAKTVITMLPSSPHVKQVYTEKDGLLESDNVNGSLFIDASTIDPIVAKEVSRKVSLAGASVLDAPVSGGIVGADAGTLTFMVGGQESDLNKGMPYLEIMGQKIVHCGESGNGQVVKVCNNLALGIEMIGISEAMNLGVKLGMDPKLLASIFNTSSARCWSSDTYNPVPGVIENVPSSKNYEGGFGVDLMAKDLGLAVNAANNIKAPLPLGAGALQFYNLVSQHGKGNKDFSYSYAFLNNESNKKN